MKEFGVGIHCLSCHMIPGCLAGNRKKHENFGLESGEKRRSIQDFVTHTLSAFSLLATVMLRSCATLVPLGCWVGGGGMHHTLAVGGMVAQDTFDVFSKKILQKTQKLH